MSVINTNITSLIGQQNLTKSQNALQTSMERLSSGLRINSAKDDAAGQAIANRMSAQIHGLQQAQRNANDGISVAQTAEGALNQINDNLQRVRELTVQAQNGTNSASDLQSIQDEINQRMDEVDRISRETSFNGVDVLAKDTTLNIQVGANDGEAIEVSLQQISASTLGLSTFNVTGPQGATSAVDATAAQAEFGDTTAITSASFTGGSIGAADFQSALGLDGAPTVTASEVVTDEQDNWFGQFTLDVSGSAADTARMEELGFDVSDPAAVDVFVALNPQDGTVNGTDLEFTVDITSFSESQLLAGGTADPLSTLDTALANVDTLRSDLGAIQNRFEDAINNLSTTETNLQAARSRIEDADYAVEVADMTRAQILQQAGTSVLAQANQVPQSVLSLLG